MKATLSIALGATWIFLLAGVGCATRNETLVYPGRMPDVVRDPQPLRAGFEAGTGVVRAVRGEAMVSLEGRGWEVLQVGRILGANAAIWTGAGSRADVFLGNNGPVIRVESESVLVINSLAYQRMGDETVSDTQFFLQRGRLLANVRKMNPRSRYEVRIPMGLLSVQQVAHDRFLAADFDLSARGNLVVTSGEISYDFNGKKFQLKTGEIFDPASGRVSKLNIPERYRLKETPRLDPTPEPPPSGWPQRKF